ncbi:helix-turn-helix transcriptional regulator [Liberibacter sp. Z1]|nr:helix-turn-helix transcriptional regulator [Candidatus Liberibacter sp.]
MVVTPETIRHWKEVGTRIRDIRKANNKTLEDMAVKTKMMRTALCSFENGRASTSINYALFLRNEFGISFDWIYEGETILKAYTSKKTSNDVLDSIVIGKRLKGLRESLGLNKVECSILMGISDVGVSNIENGNRTPRIETSLKIKKATKKHLDWIYFGDEVIIPKSVIRARKAKNKT